MIKITWSYTSTPHTPRYYSVSGAVTAVGIPVSPEETWEPSLLTVVVHRISFCAPAGVDYIDREDKIKRNENNSMHRLALTTNDH